MQSALQQPDLTVKPGNVTTLRIVTYGLRTHAVHEYLYLLDNPKANNVAVSEITALSDHTFLVDERDGKFPPASSKKLWKICFHDLDRHGGLARAIDVLGLRPYCP